MPCVKFKWAGTRGIITLAPARIDMAPFGYPAWMEFHHYCGPFFYRSNASEKEITKIPKRLWAAFDKWHNKTGERNDK